MLFAVIVLFNTYCARAQRKFALEAGFGPGLTSWKTMVATPILPELTHHKRFIPALSFYANARYQVKRIALLLRVN